jgi:uncharacterized protein (TIGR02266 family)
MPRNIVEDKRVAPRVEVILKADLKTKYIFTTAVVLNISPTGMFIKTQNPLPEGSEVEIVIHSETRGKLKPIKGVVQWERKVSSGSIPAGMGIKLNSDSIKSYKKLAKEIMDSPKNV